MLACAAEAAREQDTGMDEMGSKVQVIRDCIHCLNDGIKASMTADHAQGGGSLLRGFAALCGVPHWRCTRFRGPMEVKAPKAAQLSWDRNESLELNCRRYKQCSSVQQQCQMAARKQRSMHEETCLDRTSCADATHGVAAAVQNNAMAQQLMSISLRRAPGRCLGSQRWAAAGCLQQLFLQ